ncbi:hypothetical protein GSI_11125 [Ganoderma sinense ZZ0214-1]|uniref:Uncharacterized protein n=1 Tax=Ganoderma sinense ZZ0214-1 TaxID=1077348 RepID=A0A2G8RZ40_9APHY|nr:hypothetical protein GSI_11125 [Ganoderma sinense ZZ0214-1]
MVIKVAYEARNGGSIIKTRDGREAEAKVGDGQKQEGRMEAKWEAKIIMYASSKEAIELSCAGASNRLI